MAEFSTGPEMDFSPRCRPVRGVAIVGGDLFQFGDYALQFVDDAGATGRFECVEDGFEVPDLQIAAAMKTAPDLRTDEAIILEHGARVVELVGSRDEAHVGRLLANSRDV